MDAVKMMNKLKEKTGLSEEVIRRVQKAESELVIESLKSMDRINLTGRGVFRPEVQYDLGKRGEIVKNIKPIFKVSGKIKDALSGVQDTDIDYDDEELPDGILVLELEDLM